MSDEWMNPMLAPQPSGVDEMQVCTNGHQITVVAKSEPSRREKFCAKCGAPTITACPKCDEPIRGRNHDTKIVGRMAVPKYCINCGAPYPWQQAALETLTGALEQGELSPQDLKAAKDSVPDIVADTPRSELAILKMKNVLAKLRGPVGEVTKRVLIEVASDAAKRHLGL